MNLKKFKGLIQAIPPEEQKGQLHDLAYSPEVVKTLNIHGLYHYFCARRLRILVLWYRLERIKTHPSWCNKRADEVRKQHRNMRGGK